MSAAQGDYWAQRARDQVKSRSEEALALRREQLIYALAVQYGHPCNGHAYDMAEDQAEGLSLDALEELVL